MSSNRATHSRMVEGYERHAEPLTIGIAEKALEKIGLLAAGASVIDVGAGTGAFALVAAAAGAHVLAIDYSQDMVERLKERLAPFPGCEARQMDGQALAVGDDAFDMAASFFGIITFPDWRRGLKEMVRVTRPGGQVILATWPSANGAGPAAIGMQAYRRLFPDQPGAGGGEAALGTHAALHTALQAAGCTNIEVFDVRHEWGGQPLEATLAMLTEALELTPFYGRLDSGVRQRMRGPMRDLLAEHEAADGIVRVPVPASVAVATVASS